MPNDTNMLINYLMSTLLKTTVIPTEFHDQVEAIKLMQKDDVSGLVDILTDFSVTSASVDYNIETDNDTFTKLLKKWLETINKGYVGIPTGINPLAEEYFKERWKSSSFPILKLAEWEDIGRNIIVPTKMFFVDGGSVYAQDNDPNDENIKLVNYDYSLGSADTDEKLDKNVIITRATGRWYDKYPTPYLIKRGVYHNWKIIQNLKHKQQEILDQIIPYMLLVKKGTERLAIDKNISYSDEKLQNIIGQFQTALDKYKELDSKTKSMVRATNFDEELKHFIPDLSTIFDTKLFEGAEKNILSGLGFVDIAEAVSSSRRESILNPKPFIQETKKGVKDFKQLLKELVLLIVDKNKQKHKKFTNTNIRITSSPVTGFMTDKFKEKIRQCWDRGKISNQTAIELIAEVDFETEVKRREQEAKEGTDEIMTPNATEYIGETSDETPTAKNPDKQDKDDISDDKKDPVEKKNFKASLDRSDMDLEEAVFKAVNTKNFIRLRQYDPKLVIKGSYKTVILSKSKGIKAIIGQLNGKKKITVQSYLFSKLKDWTVQKAEFWVKEHEVEVSELVGAPYKNIKDLPSRVKKNLNMDLQRVYLQVFNKAYNTYENDALSSRVAWAVIKKIAKKKNGKWVRKTKKEQGKEVSVKLTKTMVENAIIESEKDQIDEAFLLREISLSENKKELLAKLNKKD